MTSLLSVIIGLLVILVILAGLAVWMLVDIARINRPPEAEDYPLSRHGWRK